MKALFLGAFAASQAEGIASRLKTPLDIETLAEDRDPARVAAALAETDILLAMAWREPHPAPRLKLLQALGAGTDEIDPAALPRGVILCNAYGHEPAIGEYALMMMLAWQHRLFDIAGSFRAGSWEWSPLRGGKRHGEIAGQTVGIVGLGRIGREIAWRAAALGCRVIAANRTLREERHVERVYPLAELDAMLGEADIVVLACALTEETRGLIDAGRLAAMKDSAFLINVARGAVADEDALFAALRDNAIAGAALDTWWRYPSAEEPDRRPSRQPFHELPNVIVTPHCSPWTEGTVARRCGIIAANLDRFARGEPLDNIVAKT